MTAAALTTEHQRPAVLGTDLRRFAALTWTLATTDWKLRFYGSVLGYLWTLARPFLFFGVILFVFTQIAHLDANVKHYGVYILFALVLFQFFTEATGGCVSSLVTRESLLRKIRFPRLAIPLAVVLTALFNLCMTLVAVTVFSAVMGVYPSVRWLALVPIVVILGSLATGLGLLLSVLFVRFRDVQPIWEVVSQALFYFSPILYVTTLVPAAYQRPFMANPIASVLTEMRHMIVDPGAPHAWEAIGGATRLLIPGGLVVGVVALGAWAFAREAPRVAENL